MDGLVSNSNSIKNGNNKLRKGLWSPEEDEKLMNYMLTNGQGCWSDIARNADLQRCGKSCRLRWINYLRPDLKRGAFSFQEEHLILRLHSLLGNRWSQIAARLPGRTDNEIKNFWNSTVKKRLQQSNNSLESIATSPDGSISSFDPAETFSGGTSSTQEKYDLMTPFHFPFDPYSQSHYGYTDYTVACADSLFNMEPIYSEQIDLGTDRFDVPDDRWNVELKQEAEKKLIDSKSVTCTNRNAARKGIEEEEDTSCRNAEERWSGESLKMGEIWDMEGLADYTCCSSNSFHCENLPKNQ